MPKKTTKESIVTVQTGSKNNSQDTAQGDVTGSSTVSASAKIAVIGDSWKQFLILPEDTPEKTIRESQGLWFNAGASRMVELIRMATTDKKDKDIAYGYIPKDAKPIVVTYQLKEVIPLNDPFEQLRYIGFPEDKIPKKPLRIERLLGASQPFPEQNGEKGTVSPRSQYDYIVVYSDTLYTKGFVDKELYSKEGEELLWNVWKQAKTRPPWILLHIRRLNDPFLLELMEKYSFFLADKSLKEKMIVFLRTNDLADGGIGQRGDTSIEECLEGILYEIKNNTIMKDLLPNCAAVVIENGVDSAFLLKIVQSKPKQDPNITVCQVFFRTGRTERAYQQNTGDLPGLGAFMVSSCLKALIKKENNGVLDQSSIIPGLSEGIRDGLTRMILQFAVGYPKKKNKQGTDVENPEEYLENIYRIEEVSSLVDDIRPMLDPEPVPKEPIDNNGFNKILIQNPNLKTNTQDVKIQRFWREKIGEIAYQYYVHNVGLIDRQGSVPLAPFAERDSATYISRFFRYPTEIDQLPPWLIEKQWMDIKGKDNTYQQFHTWAKEYKFKSTEEYFLDRIVRYGLKTLEQRGVIKFPVARFGNMEVVEPDEINMFYRLDNLIRKYTADLKNQKPLGLAVFGAPGAGKSYGIKEVAKAITGGIEPITCNLASFKEPEELYEKLLEARNISKFGRFPVIFLDEFDVKFKGEALGWCKYLLSVLQDGEFSIKGTRYDIGKALIVCAGGICHSFREFEWKSRTEESRDAKIPDFIGRLRGYLDIAGPNPYFPYPWNETTKKKLSKLNDKLKDINKPLSIFKEVGETSIWATGAWGVLTKEGQEIFTKEDLPKLDSLYKIRRAVLLRSVLKRNMPFIQNTKNEFNIGVKVLRALLNIPEYKYGIRSMEAIIEMSVSVSNDSRLRFTKAMLPPPEQLEMHVDAERFYRLMEGED